MPDESKWERGERGERGPQGEPGRDARENGRLATIETKLDGISTWLKEDLPVHVREIVREEVSEHVKACPHRFVATAGFPAKWLAVIIPALVALIYAVAEAYKALAK